MDDKRERHCRQCTPSHRSDRAHIDFGLCHHMSMPAVVQTLFHTNPIIIIISSSIKSIYKAQDRLRATNVLCRQE